MADWTIIPNAALDVGKPIRAADLTALRDNPISITEGATGAPRVRPAAISGDTVTAGTSRTVFSNPETHYNTVESTDHSSGEAFKFSVLSSGTIRLSFRHWRGSGGGSADVLVRKNGSTIGSWSNSGGSPTTRTIASISVSPGDRLMIFHWPGASPTDSRVDDITIQTAGEHLWLVPYGMVP